jgi:hypothetical protein
VASVDGVLMGFVIKKKVVEVPPAQSTTPSSPDTLWSQDSAAPSKAIVSRTSSLQTQTQIFPPTELTYVADLRRRMAAQEAELASLRRELTMIRERFVFPLPPTTTGRPDEDEDTMPTPRPPSGPQCVYSTPISTMDELVDSFESEPPTPLFRRTLQPGMFGPEIEKAEEDGEEEILGAGVFSDLGPGTPSSGDLSPRSFFVANPDSDGSESDKGSVRGSVNGKLEELHTARDALRSALAAMEPVEMQLKAVEKELQLRGVDVC